MTKHWWFWPLLIGGSVVVVAMLYRRANPLSVNAMGGGSHQTTWSDAIRNVLHFSGDGGLFGRGSEPTKMGQPTLTVNPDGSTVATVNMIGAKV